MFSVFLIAMLIFKSFLPVGLAFFPFGGVHIAESVMLKFFISYTCCAGGVQSSADIRRGTQAMMVSSSHYSVTDTLLSTLPI